MFSVKSIPSQVVTILSRFHQSNGQIFIVGGAVRDLYLGLPVKDWDFATNLTPSQMKKIYPNNSFYENDFGTFSIVGPNKQLFEVTTFRSESVYTDFRHPSQVEWGTSIDQDLTRRDFTINAIALKPVYQKSKLVSLEVIDPFNGLSDLKKKLITAVGDANTRFQEDAHRLIRAVRIACQIDFNIETKTMASIQANASLITKISAERVRQDFFKILLSPRPSLGVNMLHQSNLLQYIIPELTKGIGLKQKGHHVYDVWTHSLACLDNCDATDPITRLAALIHDVGKSYTVKYPQDSSGEPTFHNHEMVSGRIAKQLSQRLKLSRQQADKLYRLVRWHMFTADHKQTDKAIRRLIRHVTPDYLDDLISLRRADRLGSGSKESSWRWELMKKRFIEVQKQPFSIKDLQINGLEVMSVLNIGPGPTVGRVLNYLFQQVDNNPQLNQKEILIKLTQEMPTSFLLSK